MPFIQMGESVNDNSDVSNNIENLNGAAAASSIEVEVKQNQRQTTEASSVLMIASDTEKPRRASMIA